MPKEITYSSDAPAFLKTLDGNEYSEDSSVAALLSPPEGSKWMRRGVHVGWVKDRLVELGVAAFDPAKERPSDGVFLTLDRAAINRLIRSLRKARDQAYGADA